MVELTIGQSTFEDCSHVEGPGSLPRDVVAFVDNSVEETGNSVGMVGDPILFILHCAEFH